MSYVTAALIAAALVLIAFIVYKKYYSKSEYFSSGLDPSTRYSIAGIGPSYTQPDECPNCQ